MKETNTPVPIGVGPCPACAKNLYLIPEQPLKAGDDHLRTCSECGTLVIIMRDRLFPYTAEGLAEAEEALQEEIGRLAYDLSRVRQQREKIASERNKQKENEQRELEAWLFEQDDDDPFQFEE